MILYGMAGKGTGKKGSDVYAISGGQQIVRQYNPVVSNPNTVDQITQRSRFKLISQLAAALASSIAIPKQGLVSSRNAFVRRNMEYVYGNSGGAIISYENIQLTAGNQGLPAVKVVPEGSTQVRVSMADAVTLAANRIVYNVYKKTTEEQLVLQESHIVAITSEDVNASFTMPIPDADTVIYAYGIKDKSSSASAKYGNYRVETGQDIAALVANRSMTTADFTFTQTRGVTLAAGETETIVLEANQVLVYVTPTNGGSVSAEGLTRNRIIATIGQPITLTAEPDGEGGALGYGYLFSGWYINGEQLPFSTDNPLTITPTAQMDIVARFYSKPYEGFE